MLLFWAALAAIAAARTAPYTLCDNNTPCASPLVCLSLAVGAADAVSVCGTASPSGSPFDCSVSDTPCCHDRQCNTGTVPGNAKGKCDAWPGGVYCGGAAPPQINVCVYNECDESTACPAKSEACVSAGALQNLQNTCLPAKCSAHHDCKAGAAGECRPFMNAFPPCGYDGLYCTYADSACRDDSNCPGEQVCVFDHSTGAPACVDPSPPPPVRAPVLL